MAFFQSRRFNFFTFKNLSKTTFIKKQHQILPEDNAQVDTPSLYLFDIIKNIEITCYDVGGGQIVLGDNEGLVYKINHNFEVEKFYAYDFYVTTIQQIIQNRYLVTSGSDELNPGLIKIWNLDKIDPHKQIPLCISIIKTKLIDNLSSITSVATTDFLTLMCIGYEDGNLVLVKGDLLKEKTCKQKKVLLSNDKITGLFLKGLYKKKTNNFLTNKLLLLNSNENKQATLFVTTTKKVFVGEFKNDTEVWKEIESDFGSDSKRCCIINDEKHLVNNCEFILGNEKAIYFYQSHGPGISLGFKEEKILLHWYKGYLILITKEIIPFAKDVSTMKDIVLKNCCTIYDIQNKYIAFSSIFNEINHIFCEWNTIYLILKDGNIIELKEKDMDEKLDILFKKQQYFLALELAKKTNYDSNNLNNIFKQYGDHLYKKGDFENAINQYIKTIGNLEPSYVIRKYLDDQKLKNLAIYLFELHELKFANKDHTLLLIICLTKLGEKVKLNNFLKKFCLNTDDSIILNYDIKSAIKVLRKFRFYDEALFLCEKYNCDDIYMEIVIEDKMDILSAIDFIEKKILDIYCFTKLFTTYAKVLFKENPQKYTQLLKNIFEKCFTELKSNLKDTYAETYINNFCFDILINNPEKMVEFLEFLKNKNFDSFRNIVSNTLLELYLQFYNDKNLNLNKEILEKKIMNILHDENSNYDLKKAVLLCQINEFHEGTKFLYEKLELYDILLFDYIENNEDDKIIDICNNFGHVNGNLCVKAFLYFSKLDTNIEKNKNNLLIVIDQITKNKLLPLVSISKILSNNQNMPLSVVKSYLIDALKKEYKSINENENLILKYKDETEKICKNVENLEINGKIFQSSKCSVCNNFLDLPNVHFLCIHSFHLHCFQSICGDNENECPLCMPEHRKIMQLSEENQKINNLELIETFIKNINQVDEDSFSTVSNYFSKNLF